MLRHKPYLALAVSFVLLAALAGRFASGARGHVEPGARTQTPAEREHQPRCTRGTVRGSYGYISAGFAGPPTVPAESAGPLAGVGTVNFDPRGGFTLTATRSVNGVIDPQPLTLNGTYTVNGDCTLTMAFAVGFTFNATVVADGAEILFVETDTGTTFTVRARRI